MASRCVLDRLTCAVMRQGRTTRVSRWVAALVAVLAAGAAVGYLSAPASGGTEPARADKVVIVAVPGLRWVALSPEVTPNLWRFAATASRGLLSVKAAGDVARCGAAMTTLGAGNRAVATPQIEARCAASTLNATLIDVDALRRANRNQRFGTRPGALGDALAGVGLAIEADGAPGVQLAALTTNTQTRGSSDYSVVSIIADAGVYDARRDDRAGALNSLDKRLAVQLSSSPGRLTLIVGAGDEAYGPPNLRVAMAAGPGFDGGRLTSDSTGRAPYVELIDVAPTVLAVLNIPIPDAMAGTPWQPAGGEAAVSELVDASEHARDRRQLGGWFVALLVGLGAGTVLAALICLRRGRLRSVAEAACYFVASVPVSSYAVNLLPWWRWPIAVLGAVVVAGAAVVGASAFAVARRRPPWGGLAVVVATTGTVLALDLVSGTHLQLDSLLGDSTIVAGRFHGAGNTAFAVFATSVLLVAGLVATTVRDRGPRVAAGVAGVLGLIAVVLEGAPVFGDDFGGVLALVPTVVVLVVLTRELRVDRRVWLVAAATGVAAAAALLVYDLVASRGHIGRFASDSGGGIRTTLDRRLAAMLESWHTSAYVVMVAVALVAIAALARHPSLRAATAERPALRGGFIAVAVCAVLGGLLNDSGAVVTGAAAVTGAPLLFAGCLRAIR